MKGWEVFGVTRQYPRGVCVWVENVHKKPLSYEWHLSAPDYDDEGRAATLEEGQRRAEFAVSKYLQWKARSR